MWTTTAAMGVGVVSVRLGPLLNCIPLSSSSVSVSVSSSKQLRSVACSLKQTPLSTPSPLFLQHTDDDDDNDVVIGDCLVFEDGIFDVDEEAAADEDEDEDEQPEIQSQNLVPPEWIQVVEEINLSKKERRLIAQQSQFGHRIFNKKRLHSLNPDEYLRFKQYKLSQLNPTRLPTPAPAPVPNIPPPPSSSSTRVEPKSPRWEVYGRTLDDVSHFFNAPTYNPIPTTTPTGRRKLFTQEEKALMNARIPKLDIATSLNWLPLHTLAASGEFYLLNTLFNSQLNINAPDQDGLTALHKAILCKKQAITNYLLRESANSFARDKDGATLMHYAVQTASSQAIKTLVLHNVDINLADNDGWTPLHLAVQARRTDVVRLLLVKGADKTLKNQDGLTPLELCLHFGRDTKTYEIIKLLKKLPRQGR